MEARAVPSLVNPSLMFNLFKKKSELDKLKEQHAALLKQSFDLSKSDRTAADQKTAEAAEVEKRIIELQKAQA